MNCPACHKSDLTSDACPRCGCDLARLHKVDRAATMHLRQALECLESLHWPGALSHASNSWALRHSAPAARIAFLAAAAMGAAGQMTRWRRRAGKE